MKIRPICTYLKLSIELSFISKALFKILQNIIRYKAENEKKMLEFAGIL